MAGAALLLAVPRVRAGLGLVSGFSALSQDPRIRFEEGARDQASRLAAALPGVVERIESVHGEPFPAPFKVYLPATHRGFTDRVGMPPRSPVRGLAFRRRVWISPLAFNFRGEDTHSQSLAHELVHLYLTQRLGWLRRARHLPTWFQEGLADWVAGTGFEIVTRQQALEGIATGRHFRPDLEGRLPKPRPLTDYEVDPHTLHAQSRLFVEWLAVAEPQAMGRLLDALLAGERFAPAFAAAYPPGVESRWNEFRREVRREVGGVARPVPPAAGKVPYQR